MTTHFPDLIKALQIKGGRVNKNQLSGGYDKNQLSGGYEL